MFSATTIYRPIDSQYGPGLCSNLLSELIKSENAAIWQSRQGGVYMFREGGREFIGYGGPGA